MVSGRRTPGGGGNGKRKNDLDQGGRDINGSRKDKHRKKHKQVKKTNEEKKSRRTDTGTRRQYFQRSIESPTANADPGQAWLHESPLGDRSRQSPLVGDRNGDRPRSTDGRRHLSFGDDQQNTYIQDGPLNEANAVVIPPTGTASRTTEEAIVVASLLGSPAADVHVNVHVGAGDAVGEALEGLGGLNGRAGVVLTTLSQSNSRPANQTQSTRMIMPPRGTATMDQVPSITVQSSAGVHGQRETHTATAVPESTTVASRGAPAGLSDSRGGIQREEHELSSWLGGQRPRRGGSPGVENGGTSALQRLDNLLQSLNPHEREVFLRSHNFQAELQKSGNDDDVGAQETQAERTSPVNGGKGKGMMEEEKFTEKGEEDRSRKRLIKQLRKELRAAEEGRLPGGSSSRGAEDEGRLLSRKRAAVRTRKIPRQSTAAAKALEKADPLGPEWAAVRDVPAVEVNQLGEPAGVFRDHMQPFVFDRGAYIFPWHVNWDRQCPKLKARFILRLRKLYPGPWEAKGVLAQLGNNLRERRNRLKKRFKLYANPKAVTRPRGCSLQSWEEIYHGLRDAKKKAKSDLCKLKADERAATGGSPFSHRTGRRGYRGIVAKFVSENSEILLVRAVPRLSCVDWWCYYCDDSWLIKLFSCLVR
jgi:hypothetical protein